MPVTRLVRSGLFIVGLSLASIGLTAGCGDSGSTAPGQQVKEDPADVKKREDMIQNAYKTSPPQKGPGGRAPSAK